MPIGPQRLILINSSVYDYAEVELAGTLQIVGPNNIGKTTLIKTLQFLYLNDRRHMDFGAHSPEQTREFYFPNQYSYILFECLGVTGQHVIGWRGQSKTSGGEPERFCYSGPFVPTDFHNEKNQVREPREVDAQLSLKNLRKIKTAEEHKELLLPPASGEARGLGIVALRDSEKFHQFRETLKNLLTLSTITQEQMRDCLLMLADIPPNRTAFDARELFGNDYDSILKHKEKLDKFRQNQTFVEKLVSKFTVREAARGELLWRWTDLRAKRQKFEKTHEENLVKIREAKITLEGKVTVLEAEVADRRKDVAVFSEQKGQIAVFDPGGLFSRDPQKESAITNFRAYLQGKSVIRFADLFTLGVTVTRADGHSQTYHDLREIESHGTTISIKVLFNLLLLKGQLRRDDCEIPFYLDEIESLDDDNRRAILSEARRLGFIAVTAAPKAVSEVDALYFVQPQNGKIVLRKRHRMGVKRHGTAATK
jgi:hypothetical protein